MMEKSKINNPKGSAKRNQKSKTHIKNIKIFTYLVYVFGICFFIFDFAAAQSISSAELINNAKIYDGKTVVYEGEVIGDIMKRGEYTWINVFDGKAAIGVWLPKDLTKDIYFGGSYKVIGDRVEIRGIFNRACAQHGGDLDIHAQAIRKIATGRVVQEELNPGKRNLAVVLLGILCLILILRQLKRR